MARGTIRRRGNSFQGRVKVKNAVGEWTDASVSASTEAECERKLEALVRQARRGGDATGGRKMTVAGMLNHWLDLNDDTFSPTTIKNTRSIVNKHFANALGRKPVTKLNVADLNVFYKGLVDKGLAPSSVQRIHASLRAALKLALQYGWIGENPAALARIPKAGKSKHRITPPTVAEVTTLIHGAFDVDGDFGLFVWLATATGARRGELVALRWSRIDLDAGTLTIEFAMADGNDGCVVKDTKTGNVRTIGLDGATVQLLKEHRTELKRRALAAGVPVAADPYLFSFDEDGATPWRLELPSKRFARLADAVSLPAVRLHDLRHYSVTALLAAGVDLTTVAGRHGHAGGGRTTLAVYAHFVQSADQHAADVMGAGMASMTRGTKAG